MKSQVSSLHFVVQILGGKQYCDFLQEKSAKIFLSGYTGMFPSGRDALLKENHEGILPHEQCGEYSHKHTWEPS